MGTLQSPPEKAGSNDYTAIAANRSMKYPSCVYILAAFLAGASAYACASDRATTLLQQVAQLEPAEQQRFVGWVETRMNRANEIVLPQAEAAAARASLHARLRQSPMTWTDLQRLLDELRGRELEAVEILTRQYRVQTHRAFRRARDEYHRRQQAWFDTYTAWQKAGRPLTEQEALLNWLAEAIRASTPGSTTRLPEPPRFGARSLASLLPPQPPTPIGAKQPPAEPTRTSETHEPAASIASLPVAPQPAPPVEAPRESRLDPNSAATPKQTIDSIAIDRVDIPSEPDAIEAVAPVAYPTIAPQRAPLAPAGPQVAALEEHNSRHATKTASISTPRIDPHPPFAQEAPLPDRLGLHQTPEDPIRIDDGDLPASQMLFSDLPIVLDIEDGETPPLSRLSSEPAFGTFSISICESIPRTVRNPTVADSFPEDLVVDAPALEVPDEPPGRVNLTELRSRIAGTNMALKAMEAELYEPHRWTPAELALLTARLHTLALRVQDARLFRQNVPEDIRQLIDAADSPQPTITLLASQIAETRQRIAGSGFSGTEQQRQAALSQLDELSHRLVEIASLPQR